MEKSLFHATLKMNLSCILYQADTLKPGSLAYNARTTSASFKSRRISKNAPRPCLASNATACLHACEMWKEGCGGEKGMRTKV